MEYNRMRELNLNEIKEVNGGIIGILVVAFARGYNTGTTLYNYFTSDDGADGRNGG
jgi:hypothetical protein